MANFNNKRQSWWGRLALLCAVTIVAGACGSSQAPAREPASVHIAPLVGGASTPAAHTAPGRDKIVFLDAGHGGKDWGSKARKPDGEWIAEKTYTLDIALRTADALKAAGYTVVLSRTSDVPADQWAVNNPPRDLNGDGEIDGIDDVQARINIANRAHADVLLSIHLNGHAFPNGAIDPSFSGVTTLWDPDRPFSTENKRLATLVQREMLAAVGAALGHAPRDWGTADDTTLPTPFTTSHTTYNHDVELGPSSPKWVDASQMPGVISEPLFMTNPDEQAVLLRDDVRQQIAAGYVRAIDAYFRGAGG